MARKSFPPTQVLHLVTPEAFVVFSDFVPEATKASVSARDETRGASAWSSAVITIEKSVDGLTWGSTSTTLTAAGMTADIDISTARMLRARVSTAQSNAGYAVLSLGLLLADDQ